MKMSEIIPNRIPPTVCIELLRKCNMACPHCRSYSSPTAPGVMPFHTVATFIDKLATVGNWRFSLTGGEPTLWEPLPLLITRLAKSSSVFSVTTNGSSSSLRILNLSPNVWRTGTLKVSLDGSRKYHDTSRGSGTYDKALYFIRQARPLIRRLCVNTILLSDASLWIEELHRELRSIPIDKWSIISPVGREKWSNHLMVKLPDGPYYILQFDIIAEHNKLFGNQIPLAFLNYEALEGKLRNVVYVNADGHIELPGYLDGISSPVASTTHIDATNAIDLIVKATREFESNGLILQ